ncbi:MAG TPA: ATP-binding protein [Anaerolineales bacterium]|nr:ATP-binding protein [Anaerolineales bacterium]HNB86063.1 ATP-binding protein [Anaerolineales bacterium]HNE68298.1 ATP-binding protein [Anaerolineales bacterium]
MDDKSGYKEPLSSQLRRRVYGNEEQIAETVRWVAYSSLFILLVLVINQLFKGRYIQTLVILAGTLPIIISLLMIKSGKLSLPISIFATGTILLLTYISTVGNGIHDVANMAFPIILIVTGLILRGRVLPYLTGGIILCLGWLVFGDMLGLYKADTELASLPEDFLFASAIILVTSNAVHLLVENIRRSLIRAREEIAEREKAEMEREELVRQLKLKNQELDRFAITVSHDLKTPLITITGYLGYLERDALAGNMDRVHKDISQVNEAAKNMGKLVDEILDLSRIGRIMNPPREVDFAEIVGEALKASSGLLQEKQVRVKVGSEFPIVYCDFARIVQVIQNLVTNAAKFMGEQPVPVIEIDTEVRNNERVFFVRDNGMGIDPKYHEQIFGLFNKLNAKADGLGIGLGIVKRIIEVHEGRVWVESETGNGASFYFTLPDKPLL